MGRWLRVLRMTARQVPERLPITYSFSANALFHWAWRRITLYIDYCHFHALVRIK